MRTLSGNKLRDPYRGRSVLRSALRSTGKTIFQDKPLRSPRSKPRGLHCGQPPVGRADWAENLEPYPAPPQPENPQPSDDDFPFSALLQLVRVMSQ